MKKYLSKEKLKQKMLSGSKKLAENVGSTLGPKGRNVILHPHGHSPIITKDGVTVAKFFELEDPFENVAAESIKQASLQTNEDAGDGTTTACVLANALFVGAQKHIAAGVAPISIARGISRVAEKIANKISEKATRITSLDDIRHIATVSANGDGIIGELIAEAVDIAGKDGAIGIEEAREMHTTLEKTEGYLLPGGYTTNAFINDSQNSLARYQNARILIVDERIEEINQILNVLQLVAEDDQRPPLVIACDSIDGEAHAAVIGNYLRGIMRIVCINVPGYGDEKRENLKDLAAITGGTFFSKREGRPLREFQLSDLGYAKNVEIARFHSMFLNYAGDENVIEMRKNLLRQDVEKAETIQEAARFQERLSRLASAAVIIKVGAMTEVEMIEKKHRIEDALEAVRSAQEEGMLPGGGTALLKILQEIEDDGSVEHKLMQEACEAPLRKICENAGISGDVVLHNVLKTTEFATGYNAATEEICDLIKAGVIDPAKVTRCALINATSAAKTLLTADHAIIERKNEG